MNHNCHGEFFIANEVHQYRCFADSSIISSPVCNGDQCPCCARTIVAVTVEADEEIDLKAVLEQSFAEGLGVLALSASMTDGQILTLIKGACAWSKGKAFQVIPPPSE